MANSKQQKLRQLMKEKKASSENAKINSPLARYNSVGQLSCALCNVPVKSNILWTAHVQSKKHKETIALLKAQKESSTAAATKGNNVGEVTPSAAATAAVAQKRKQTIDNNDKTTNAIDGAKRLKVDDTKTTTPATSSISPELLAEAESDPADTAEGSHDASSHDADNSTNNATKQSLPADFFDNNQEQTDVSNDDGSRDEAVVKEKERSDSSSKLPQGFFDDPKADAKVRKVEYKDPELEEWEKFKKSIIEENKVSDNIMDEEDDEAKVDREITELTEQSECYTKAEILRQKQELLRRKKSEMKNQQMETVSMVADKPDQTSDSENEELEEFLNWRSKVV